MMASLYELHGIRQVYGQRTVLDIAHLTVEAGETLAVVGPSGSGKSTLLRLLNFLEAPTAGRIVYDGQEVGPRLPLDTRRQVAMVFQRPALQQASVRANVAYGLRLRGIPADGRVDALLERVGLLAQAKQAARTLSGGEMQRVALARALVIGPRVLLLDEPTANLDPYNVKLIEAMVAEAKQQGTTPVIVTHNVFQAKRLADRVAFLLDGRLVEVAPTPTFFNAPQDPRTLAFVQGDMVY